MRKYKKKIVFVDCVSIKSVRVLWKLITNYIQGNYEQIVENARVKMQIDLTASMEFIEKCSRDITFSSVSRVQYYYYYKFEPNPFCALRR